MNLSASCDSNPCPAGVECINVDGGYYCDCPAGYEGSNCGDINECDDEPCMNGGACTNTDGSYDCECVDYFEGDNCETG